MKEIKQKIENALQGEIPFVIYRKPNSEFAFACIQNDNSVRYTEDFNEHGFVFAPFDGIEKSLFIPESHSLKERLLISKISFEENNRIVGQQNREEHIELVRKGVDFINSTEVDKVVLSRKEVIDFEEIDYWYSLEKLISSHQNAFVYMWFHPLSGMWIGATPEVLLSINKGQFNIMSLASTQEYNGSLDVSWNKKEIEEHQIVTDYIVSKLEAKNIDISEAYTVKAGNLVHLRADISGRISSTNFNLKTFIDVLHPTPAVCGMPKESAKDFILTHEDYNREYYTGFLGEICDQSIDLFVNLRCMKLDIENKQTSLYIGGGITKGSNPEKEWEETVAKSHVIKKVL